MQTLHHIHRRKHHNRAPLKFLDYLVYIGASIGPIITIPQIYTIWVEKNASGVSHLTWLGYALGSSLWIIYGIVHKEKPILFTNIAMVTVQIIVLVGAIIY